MKIICTLFFTFLLSLIYTYSVHAQDGLSGHFGVCSVMPDQNISNITFNNVGITLGVDYHQPINKKGLSLVLSADLLNNKYFLDKEYLLEWRSFGGKINAFPVNDYVGVTNMPLMAGLSLKKTFSDETEFFISGSVGPDFMYVSKIPYTQNNKRYVYSSSLNTIMASKLSAGFVFDEQYSVKFDFLFLLGEIPYSDNSNVDLSRLGVKEDSNLALTFGISF